MTWQQIPFKSSMWDTRLNNANELKVIIKIDPVLLVICENLITIQCRNVNLLKNMFMYRAVCVLNTWSILLFELELQSSVCGFEAIPLKSGIKEAKDVLRASLSWSALLAQVSQKMTFLCFKVLLGVWTSLLHVHFFVSTLFPSTQFSFIMLWHNTL